jgi:hypothetical protein
MPSSALMGEDKILIKYSHFMRSQLMLSIGQWA